MMIDWVSCYIPILHDKPISGGMIVSITSDGKLDYFTHDDVSVVMLDPNCIEWRTEKRLSVRGSHESNIVIRSDHSKGRCSGIRLDGNPVKFLQGHNVWGSCDLGGLIASVLARVLPQVAPELNIKPELYRVYAGLAHLTRIDLNEMWDLGNSTRVQAWLRAAADASILKYRGRGQFSGDTLYWGKGSKRWFMKAYSKGLELRAHKFRNPQPDNPNLLKSVTDFADGLLRIELQLRALELEKLGLSTVSDWQDDTFQTVYTSYLSRLEFSENMIVANTPPDFEKLPPRLRGPVQLWYAGHDLKTLYPRATWYRYRSEILKATSLDIALSSPHKAEEVTNVVRLVTVLEAKPTVIPDWAYGTPLYFEPLPRGKHLKAV
jgi:II/X family phage/plasmid replication protein